jgi:hypothetical protein
MGIAEGLRRREGRSASDGRRVRCNEGLGTTPPAPRCSLRRVLSQELYELFMRDGRLWKLAEIAKSLKRGRRRAPTLTGCEEFEFVVPNDIEFSGELQNSGSGKTHIALGLGLAAWQRGFSVGFTTAAALVHELMEARDEKRLLRLQKQLLGHRLLVIDELGFGATQP